MLILIYLMYLYCLQCSVACGGGHRTRPVTCVIPLTGETVPDSKCAVLRKPRDHEYCNEHSCKSIVFTYKH